MPISILPPAPAPSIAYDTISSSDEDEEFDLEGDVDMEGAARGTKRPRISQRHIVTPGELVTDDTQWMR
jgi:exosome complex component RRP4